MKAVQPRSPVLALGDEIRADAPRFVEAATRRFREIMLFEYHRARGYAYESGVEEIDVNVCVSLCFASGARAVSVKAVPNFTPAPRCAHEAIDPVRADDQ